MTKIFILLVFVFFNLTLEAQVPETAPKPRVEAVPDPTKVSGALTGAAPTDLGLIKTQKQYVDKSCKMIKGKLKCPRKFLRRKTIK